MIPFIGAVLLFACFFALSGLALLKRRHPSANAGPAIAIVVLGDLARSPRMLYHAQSCIQAGRPVWLIGYLDNPLPPSLIASPLLEVLKVMAPPDLLSRLPSRLVQSACKVLWMSAALVICLFCIESPAYILLQNPPALPTLPIVRLHCILRRTKLVIDWHNTGASVLALKFDPTHRLVRFAELLEATFGRTAHCHLFVTRAMLEHLSHHWRLRGMKRVHYDRPPMSFRRLDDADKAELFRRLVTEGILDKAFAGQERPVLLVSSTSWTADEDFTILLAALSCYEQAARRTSSGLPRLYAVVTGKGGTLRREFEQEASRRARHEQWHYVNATTAWLAREDYPRLLGAADVGVSLHSSSSGLDLPMKVVDMFGCGLPVLALGFPALGELVQDNVNGRVFDNADQLAAQLKECLQDFPHNPGLERWRRGISQARADGTVWDSWEEGWNRVVAPVLGIT